IGCRLVLSLAAGTAKQMTEDATLALTGQQTDQAVRKQKYDQHDNDANEYKIPGTTTKIGGKLLIHEIQYASPQGGPPGVPQSAEQDHDYHLVSEDGVENAFWINKCNPVSVDAAQHGRY